MADFRNKSIFSTDLDKMHKESCLLPISSSSRSIDGMLRSTAFKTAWLSLLGGCFVLEWQRLTIVLGARQDTTKRVSMPCVR